MNSDFAHLHVHTQYSLLDGAIRLEELFKAAVADKMEAVAITDHGNLFGGCDFYHQAKKNGIKPILGCEVYLAPGNRHMRGNHPGGDDELAPYTTCRSGVYHLILLAQNEIGYRNLCQLISLGHLEGFYYKPRVDKEILEKYNEGLIALTGCLKGEVTSQALVGDMDRARSTAKWYRDVFKDRFYLELQHNNLPQQMIIQQRFQELSEELNIPLVASADCHYMEQKDAVSQDILMAIQTGKQCPDPNHIHPQSDEFYFKSQSLMKKQFSFCPEAIENTLRIAKSCEFEFQLTDSSGKKIYHLPKIEPPESKSLEHFLRDEAQAGLEKRIEELQIVHERTFTEEERKKYAERLKTELGVINKMGFAGYFLIVADFIRYSKENGIPVGPGRGSGAGSLVAYSLRITGLDPIELGLLFERFLNPERVSMPDFDIDFCMENRQKTIDYVTNRYGKDCVAQIITFGKLQARGVIRDVGRVFGMPVPEVDKIAKLVPATLNITLDEALEQEPRLRKLAERDPKIHQLFKVCRSLEGLYRHASIHAAGLVISNHPMVEHCPLYRGKEGELVVQFDMNNVERIGLIKFDFLGLKTLTFLQHAEGLVNGRHKDVSFDLEKIDRNDKKMFKVLSQGDTLGVFQLESSGMQDLLRRVGPDAFGDIVAINALYRPGPIGSGMLDDFIARKHGEVTIEYDFPQLEPILHETYGVIIYQEQVQQIAVSLANYTLGSADILRRAMGKKKVEEMAKQKVTFLTGALKNNLERQRVEKVFDLMSKFAGYGFNKSHAAAYALIACQTAYIKAHYPVEFFASLLTIERENTDKITKYIADARRHQIAVLPPDINESETDFTVLSEQQIRFGLGAIKGVGQIAIDEILAARKQEGAFTDLFDLCSRANTRIVNKRVLEALTKAGAFDGFKVNRASLFKVVDSALEAGSSIQKTRDDKQNSFADLLGEEDSSFTQRKITYPNEPPWDRLQELKFEKDTIGFYVSGHPLDNFEYELNRYTMGTIGKCNDATHSGDVLLGAMVSALREIMTKRGDRMAFGTFEDKMDQIEAVIFSDVFLEYESILKGGEPIWVRGKLERGENQAENKLILSKKDNAKIMPLRYAYEELAREVHLHVSVSPEKPSLPTEKLLHFQQYLTSCHIPGGCPLFLHLDLGLDRKASTVLRLRGLIPVQRDIIEQIHNFFGEERTRVEFQ